MPILPPNVSGPISPCSSSILLTGQIPGYEITIFAYTPDGSSRRTVATGIATAVEEVFGLLPGITLNELEIIRAQQTDPLGEVSLDIRDGVEVMLTPARSGPRGMGRVMWLSRLHECGRCTMLGGVFPGARIKIVDRAGITIGEEVSPGPIARLGLTRTVRGSETLIAQEAACDVSGLESPSPLPHSFLNAELPPPQIGDPLIACMRRIYVGGVFEGATVKVRRERISEEPFELVSCFDASGLYFLLSAADQLKEGDQLSAQQGYPDCEKWSGVSRRTVNPTSPLPKPRILSPICANNGRVYIDNLIPDAIVHIKVGDVEIGYRAAAATFDVFLIPPLSPPPDGKPFVLAAYQELCEVISETSESVPIQPEPTTLPEISMGQLFECATTIQLDHTVPNALIQILAIFRGVLATLTATSDTTLISVPALTIDDVIIARERSCGAETSTMAGVIRPSRKLRVPSIFQPVIASDSFIEVRNAFRGAIVEVYVDNALGSFLLTSAVGIHSYLPGGESLTKIPISHRLQGGDRISVGQRLCPDLESERSSVVTVKECKGQVRIGLKSVLAEDGFDDMRILVVQADWMRQLFRNNGWDVVVVDKERLSLPDLRSFRSDDVASIRSLAEHRNNLHPGDIPCYLVPAGDSGGVELRGITAAIIYRSSDVWTLAHEVGHVFGLGHAPAGETFRLMNPGGAIRAGASPSLTDPRALSAEDIDGLQRNRTFMHPCP